MSFSAYSCHKSDSHCDTVATDPPHVPGGGDCVGRGEFAAACTVLAAAAAALAAAVAVVFRRAERREKEKRVETTGFEMFLKTETQ